MTKKFRPITPGQRELVLESHADLTKGAKPRKNLCSLRKTAQVDGTTMDILLPHRGGGHKRVYRSVDFQRDKV